jgi:hypothetical protein
MVTLRPFTVTDPAPGRTCEKTAIAAPLGEVLAITTLDRAGLRRMRDTSKATAGIQANTVSPEFGKVQAPVLALYSDVSAQDAFPWLQGEAAERAASVFIGRQRPEMLIRAATLRGRRHRSADCRVPGAPLRVSARTRRDGQARPRVSVVGQVNGRPSVLDDAGARGRPTGGQPAEDDESPWLAAAS